MNKEDKNTQISLTNQNYRKLSKMLMLDSKYKCDVCLDSTEEPGNFLITCDLCKFSVHQVCHMGRIAIEVPK